VLGNIEQTQHMQTDSDPLLNSTTANLTRNPHLFIITSCCTTTPSCQHPSQCTTPRAFQGHAISPGSLRDNAASMPQATNFSEPTTHSPIQRCQSPAAAHTTYWSTSAQCDTTENDTYLNGEYSFHKPIRQKRLYARRQPRPLVGTSQQ
jgi:hypothetical protein